MHSGGVTALMRLIHVSGGETATDIYLYIYMCVCVSGGVTAVVGNSFLSQLNLWTVVGNPQI